MFAAVIFFALGFSTKWIVLYGAVGMLALLAAIRIREISKIKGGLGAKYAAFFDHPFLLILSFIGVVAVIYFLTYIPDMLAGDSILDIFNLQFAMFNFHSGSSVVQVHGLWDNAWWSWPFVLNPLWLAVSYLPNGIVSTIMLLGNPAVWWVGFACIILLVGRVVLIKELFFKLRKKLTKKKQFSEEISFVASNTANSSAATEDANNGLSDAPQIVTNKHRTWDLAAIFIVVIFFFQWLPYMLISRITYIYHFYVNVPILCLASAYFLNKIWDKKYGKAATIAYLAVVVAVFVLFYSVISGMPTTRSWIDSLKLFGKNWLQP